MAHSLILGISESGKTTLARKLSAEYKRAGVGVIVLDPLRDPRWSADVLTTNADEFLATVWRSRSCMLFIDEAGEAIGRYDVAMQKVVTRGRHWGHSAHIITQRGAQLSPTVRDQCRHLFLFCTSRQDGELLAREWNEPQLAECSKLKQGEYFHASRFGGIRRASVTIGGSDNGESVSDYRGAGARRDRAGDEGKAQGNGLNGGTASDASSASDASGAEGA